MTSGGFLNEPLILKIRRLFTKPQFRIFLIVIILLFVALIWAIYFLISSMQKASKNDIDRFTKLIVQHLSTAAFNDKEATLTLSNFDKTNDHLLPDYNWKSNSLDFTNFLNEMVNVLRCVINKKSTFFKSEKCWDILAFTVEYIAEILPARPTYQMVPFGTNWYEFSISFPRLLVFSTYLYRSQFNKFHKKMADRMKNTILGFLPSPISSMGWIREGPNTVMMCVPYLGGQIISGNKQYINTTEMKYVLNQIEMNLVSEGQGLYHDSSFIFHEHLRAYGYFYDAHKDYVLLMDYFKTGSKKHFVKVHQILEHPKIQRHFAPLFTRSRNFNSKVSGSLGFYTIDSSKIISVKTNEFILQFFGQNANLYCYESDQADFRMAQVWAMARILMTSSFPEKVPIEIIPFLPGVISDKGKLIERKSTTTTTDAFLCQEATCIITKFKDAIGIYNRYYSKELKVAVVEEMAIITEAGILSGYYIDTKKAPGVSVQSLQISGACSSTCEKKGTGTPYYTTAENINCFVHVGENDTVEKIMTKEGDFYNHLKINFSTNNEAVIEQTTKTVLSYSSFERNYLESFTHTLVYKNPYLFFYEKERNNVSVGLHSDVPLRQLVFNKGEIVNNFGQNSAPKGSITKGDKIYEGVQFLRLSSILDSVEKIPEFLQKKPSEITPETQ